MSYKVVIKVQGSQVVVRPDVLVMNKADANAPIHFKLKTPGFVFPDTRPYGIDIDDAGDEFDDYCLSEDKRRVRLINRNDTTATYKYAVEVIEVATGKSYSVDPTIKNQN